MSSTERVREWRSRIKNKADLWDKVDEARKESIRRAAPELTSFDDGMGFMRGLLLAVKHQYGFETTALRMPERIHRSNNKTIVFDWGNTPPNETEYYCVNRAISFSLPMDGMIAEHIVAGLGPMPGGKLKKYIIGAQDTASPYWREGAR